MNRNYPKITIITVTFNAIQYLEQTIKSVTEQNYPNIEYIIIDGASTDGTIDIIKKYESHISYWSSEPDNGIYDAMNKGIDVATGEWINFMNAGDSFCEITTVYNVINEIDDDTDLISGDMYYIKNKNKSYIKPSGLKNSLQGMFCFHQTLFTKKSIIKKYKFNSQFKISGDYDFVIKCYMNNYIFKFVNFPIANFIANGISEQNPIEAKIEDMFVQFKYLNNAQDIFNLASYNILEDLRTDKNKKFVEYLNKLYMELNYLDLKQKKFILYGYGNIGKIIYREFQDNIIAIVDKNYKELTHQNNIKIFNITELIKIDAEYIVISVLGKEKEIIEYLEKMNLLKNKNIITIKI